MPEQDLIWNDAIQRVLQDAGGAMHYVAIAEKIKELGLRQNMGANPAVTVNATIANPSYNRLYQRVDTGVYALRSALTAAAELQPGDSDDAAEAETGALKALGMYWERSEVNWQPTRPLLMGRQSAGDVPVDFAEQIGVYLLHDRDRVIYVGRATDSISDRLKAHTADRMRGRWDRFSWFGLFGVSEEGKIIHQTVPWSQSVVIETLEALLIESLEPPLNRRRGDNFAAVEYLQATDPEIEKRSNDEFLAKIARVLKGS